MVYEVPLSLLPLLPPSIPHAHTQIYITRHTHVDIVIFFCWEMKAMLKHRGHYRVFGTNA